LHLFFNIKQIRNLMIFDVHNHISKKIFYKKIEVDIKKNPAYEILECTYATLIKNMLANGINKSCIFPFPFKETKIDKANNYILEAYEKNKELFIPFFLIGGEIDTQLIKKNGIKGFKEHFALGNYQNMSFYNKYYDYLEANNMFLLIHPHMIERIEKIKYLKENFPKLKIILAHSGRKWPFTADEVYEKIFPELHKYDQLYFDTSTTRESKSIEKIVNKYGADKIIFGSDFPYYKEKGENIYENELKTIFNAKISDDNKQAILENNFTKLFLNDKFQLYRCMKEDKSELLTLISNIPSEEKKFLAIDKKINNIKRNIADQQHLFLAKKNNSIVGFIRESGRPQNGAIIEEIYIHNSARGLGIAKLLINLLKSKFDYLEAKTFSNNDKIVGLFKSLNGIVEKKSTKGSIFYWRLRK